MEALWFCLVVFMFGTYGVLGGTDIGVGMLLWVVGKDGAERSQAIRSIRPVWKPNEVWLLAAGGVLFAAFPAALAVSFSGFYLALTVVVWLLAIRGVGLELRHQVPDLLWGQFWDSAIAVGSLLLALCFGAALGNIVRGVPLNQSKNFFEPLWTDFRVGDQTGILDWYTVLVGLTAAAALAHHGTLWLNWRADGPLCLRANRAAVGLGVAALALWAALCFASLVVRHELMELPRSRGWGLIFPLIASGGIGLALDLRRRGRPRPAYLASSTAIYGVVATAAVGIYPDILPARNAAFSLSVYEVAAPRAALIAALGWWLPGILLVGFYFAFMYSRMPKKIEVRDPHASSDG